MSDRTGDPLVSVIVAARNEEKAVGLALASVLAQPFADLEIVAVDDASTDATHDVLCRYAAYDPRVVVLHSDVQLGRSDARNTAIRRSRGELIAILDADDIVLPWRFTRQVEYLARHPEVGMLGGCAYVSLPWSGAMRIVSKPCDDASIRHCIGAGIMPFVHTSMVFRRDVIVDSGWYLKPTPDYNEDYYLVYRAIKGTKAANILEPLVMFDGTGLYKPSKLQEKYRQFLALERLILRQDFGWRRLISYVERAVFLGVVPAEMKARVMSWRLHRLPQVAEHDRNLVAEWLGELAQLRRSVEHAGRGDATGCNVLGAS